MTVRYPGGRTRSWDTATGRALAPLDVPPWELVESSAIVAPDHVRGIVSPDGRWAVRLVRSGATEVWSAETGERVAELQVAAEAAFGAAFHPDGDVVATVSGRDVAHLWEVGTWTLAGELRTPEQPIERIGFSADGNWIYTSSGEEGGSGTDLPVHVWRARDRSRVMNIATPEPRTGAPRFHPSSGWILTPLADRRVLAWPLDPLGEARRRAPRGLESWEIARFGVPTDGEGSR